MAHIRSNIDIKFKTLFQSMACRSYNHLSSEKLMVSIFSDVGVVVCGDTNIYFY